jgi:hypothetical protein
MRQNAYNIRKNSFALYGVSVNARYLIDRDIFRLENGETINFFIKCISNTVMYCAVKTHVVKRMKNINNL